jgi:Fe-Mn family superoxide dismutase
MKYKHTVSDLPYREDALSPVMSEETLRYHHGKHHHKYADELNKLINEDPALHELNIEDLLKDLSLKERNNKVQKIINNAGGYYNHSIWWPMMTPKGSKNPDGVMNQYIKSNFGSFKDMMSIFSESASSHFGSGWCWISIRGSNMSIICTDNQSNPILEKSGYPILGIDLWEHAYYIDYRNRKKEYIKSFLKIINWKEVENRFLQAEAWNTNIMN